MHDISSRTANNAVVLNAVSQEFDKLVVGKGVCQAPHSRFFNAMPFSSSIKN